MGGWLDEGRRLSVDHARDLQGAVDRVSIAASNETGEREEWGNAERLLYYRLRDVYRQFRQKLITQESGADKKQKAIEQYKLDKQNAEKADGIVAWHVKFWNRVEQAGTEYRTSPSIETADKFVEAVYRVPRKQ